MSTGASASESHVTAQKDQRKRGCLFYVKRGLLALVILTVGIPVAGVMYQSAAEASDRQAYPPPGQMVNVDGHRLHLHCTGEGGPTIILEAGAFSFSSEWYWVQQQLSETHKVCSYDRAGNGWSEPVTGLRDGVTLMRELHGLLVAAGIPGPYVLAGHSLGGPFIRIYAQQYPAEVLGLVLVDSAVPYAWSEVSGFEQWKAQNESAYGLLTVLQRVGAARIIIQREFQGYSYPPEIVNQLTAFKATAQGVDTWDAEFRLAQWDLGQQSRAAEDLDELPVIVMWASYPDVTAPEERAYLESVWASVPEFSSNSRVLTVEGSNHGSIIGNEQYAQQVSDAILDVIEAAETGEPLAQ
jgi:pimeloyl-ACP methyl ester carboxylesterase